MTYIPHISQYRLVGNRLVLKSRSLFKFFFSIVSLCFFALPTNGFTTDNVGFRPQFAVKPVLLFKSLNVDPPLPIYESEQSYQTANPSTVQVEDPFVKKAISYIRSVNHSLTDNDARAFAVYVKTSAGEHRLDKLLLLALLKVESRFDPNAVSKSGAKGLAQIVPRYHMDKIVNAAERFDDDIFHPGLNIFVGAQVLREYLNSSKTVTMALLKYNGSTSDPTQYYARVVLSEYDRVKTLMS